MTSYANDTTTAAAAPPATTTTTATSAGEAPAAAAGTTAGNASLTAVGGMVTAASDSSKAKSGDNLSIGRTAVFADEDGNSSDGREKADTTPENLKKIAEIIDSPEDGSKQATSPLSVSPRHVQLRNPTGNPGYVGLGAAIDESCGKFCLGKPPPSPAEKAAAAQSRANQQQQQHHPKSAPDEEENSSESNATTKAALAFTIDHFDDATENDAAAQAARYKNMMERFQSRHKRGASMSKLETEKDNNNTTLTTTTSNSGRHSQRSSLDAGSSMADDISSMTAATPSSEQAPPSSVQVKMRVRDRSASRVRDASKRHSWSPRSSANAASAAEPTPQAPRPASRSKLPAAKGTSNLVANRTTNQFTPRSTAMQLALRQVEMLCPEPPLADGKHLTADDAVSEAGTYTLDGDNYTEEQKDLMNIDRNGKKIGGGGGGGGGAAVKMRPKQLPVKANRGSNVLEVNFYHETPLQEQQLPPAQRSSTGAYLDQLKSRVLRQPAAPLSPPTPPSPAAADVGCFTSVTTSGVLAKQRALDTHPKLTRHSHSLSTSQIDSSEYVSNEAKLRHTQALAGSATDRQKAEYRLNVFTTSTNQQQQHPHHHHHHHQLPETPTTPTSTTQGSEAALLQTAQTKQDWIQEWARNARARSLAQDVSGTSASRRKQQQQQQQQLMTRSYNCSDTGGDSLTDDSLSLYNQQQQQRQYAAAAKLNRSLAERYRLLGDCDYASDPALCSHGGHGQGQAMEPPYKPPKSPSKIPSPLHTLGRARSASRSRPPTDAYLEQTAAAISNLQQSLSRRSSVKSPAQSSPQHSLESGGMMGAGGAGGGYRRSPLHRALMTSSINEAQLQLLTSGEYLLKQLRRRKNSLEYDPGQEEVEQDDPVPAPASPLSPLRRSTSFQQHQQQGQQGQHPVQRQARPNFQNLYTPPAARHAHALSTAHQQQQLKKSASSNNFEQAYSDYDNELQYYINDEDEMGTTGAYYSSNEEEEEDLEHDSGTQGSVPLSNTRMNKALLMRIERSKQRVNAPVKPTSAPAAGKLASVAQSGAGLVACPNTPEMPRRGIKSAPRAAPGSGGPRNTRQSMPRETSLSRLAQQVPSSLANAKKQLLQTANAGVNANPGGGGQRVQPKYLDISKYKSAQSNNFLRKNDSKSTLKPADQMKRSPSASSMGLSRGEGTRASNRSVRSAASAMNTSTTSLGGGGTAGGRASSAVRRDLSVNKQKEAEMAMWKRRSTYDPMKAAAEDRRKKEEARRAQSNHQAQRQMNDLADEEVPFESVLRPANNLTITSGGVSYSPRNSVENDAWTLGESSEFGEYPDDYDENEEVDEEEQEEDVEHDDDDYVGQESDDVFEAESGEAAAQ